MERDIPKASLILLREIAGEVQFLPTTLYYLEYLCLHMPAHLFMPALEWLLKNKLTGQKFLDFVSSECQDSGLELIRYMTMRLERERELRVLTGKDIR